MRYFTIHTDKDILIWEKVMDTLEVLELLSPSMGTFAGYGSMWSWDICERLAARGNG